MRVLVYVKKAREEGKDKQNERDNGCAQSNEIDG